MEERRELVWPIGSGGGGLVGRRGDFLPEELSPSLTRVSSSVSESGRGGNGGLVGDMGSTTEASDLRS